MQLRPASLGDSDALAAIYNHYVLETIVTFEEAPVSAAEMSARIAKITSAGFPWLVAERDSRILGYAYGSPWNERTGYRYSAEVTVYLDNAITRQGVGSALYRELIRILEANGAHTLIGGIGLPNDASVALHEKFGFERVALYSEVGCKFGRWIDVGYWQRMS